MRKSVDLFSRVKLLGISLELVGKEIKYCSENDVPESILEELKESKKEIIEVLKKGRMWNCWLDEKGRFCARGLPPGHISRLELLVCLGASLEEIENHIHPIGTSRQWRQWTGEKAG